MNIRKTTGANAKPSSPRQSRDEATNQIAWTIIEAEQAERKAKTERLRLARLEREASEANAAAAAPAPKRRVAARSKAAKTV